MNNIDIKIKFLEHNKENKQPFYATEGSAGMDLAACIDEDIVLAPMERVLVPTGIAIKLPSSDYGAFLFARSGLACKKGLAPANKVGVIDSDYRGEIKVALHNHGKEPQTVLKGERVAQMVIMDYHPCAYIESESLDETKRGEGGFGSTGRK